MQIGACQVLSTPSLAGSSQSPRPRQPKKTGSRDRLKTARLGLCRTFPATLAELTGLVWECVLKKVGWLRIERMARHGPPRSVVYECLWPSFQVVAGRPYCRPSTSIYSEVYLTVKKVPSGRPRGPGRPAKTRRSGSKRVDQVGTELVSGCCQPI